MSVLLLKRSISILLLFLASACINAPEKPIHIGDIRIRDPFILPHAETGTYYMYAQMQNRLDWDGRQKGVEVYTSKDLEYWDGPEPAFIIPADFWAQNMVWAPEVHEYNDLYYLFVTFTSHDTLLVQKPVQMEEWPRLYERGTQILVSESPAGPFEPFANKAQTPIEWSALDGTLFIEAGLPFMVFCHEWSQVVDGTIEAVQLSADLSVPVGEPFTLFRASDADWVRHYLKGYVTDGPFFYRTSGGKLIMGWSSFGESGYAIGTAVSETGMIQGPWVQSDLLFAENGGHGMLFTTFEGELMLSFHQPNSGQLERAQIYRVKEVGDRLIINEKYLP